MCGSIVTNCAIHPALAQFFRYSLLILNHYALTETAIPVDRQGAGPARG